jgi:hypothetical protein
MMINHLSATTINSRLPQLWFTQHKMLHVMNLYRIISAYFWSILHWTSMLLCTTCSSDLDYQPITSAVKSRWEFNWWDDVNSINIYACHLQASTTIKCTVCLVLGKVWLLKVFLVATLLVIVAKCLPLSASQIGSPTNDGKRSSYTQINESTTHQVCVNFPYKQWNIQKS